MIGESDRVTNQKPLQFELISSKGEVIGPFNSLDEVRAYAKQHWPDQEQDDERSGKGWDVAIVHHGRPTQCGD